MRYGIWYIYCFLFLFQCHLMNFTSKKTVYTDLEHELVYYVGAGLGNKPPPPVAG